MNCIPKFGYNFRSRGSLWSEDFFVARDSIRKRRLINRQVMTRLEVCKIGIKNNTFRPISRINRYTTDRLTDTQKTDYMK